jgi:Patatin-like phospholipase
MAPRLRCFLAFVTFLALAGCQTVPRRDAPPTLIDNAAPNGFPSSVRLLGTDLRAFSGRAEAFFGGIRRAANEGPVNILALSGGGAGGAFGAGALVGLSRAHARPQFQMVTGVSAGALIAPFAYLGSDWDERMHQALSGENTSRLVTSPGWNLLERLLFPLGFHRRSALFDLVDRFVTNQMIESVARETAKGRQLIVATTDLDKQESVLWNLGAIAAQGGDRARRLFRDVILASASVPGLFPPVLIHVRDDDTEYDELHADGSVTTPTFAIPLAVTVSGYPIPQLRGAHLYIIINDKLARAPQTTPINTIDILEHSFSAGTTYMAREAIVRSLAASRRLGMELRITEIPVDYPLTSFLDFRPQTTRALFDYAEDCAERGLLWLTPEQSLRRNMNPENERRMAHPLCPAEAAASRLQPARGASSLTSPQHDF